MSCWGIEGDMIKGKRDRFYFLLAEREGERASLKNRIYIFMLSSWGLQGDIGGKRLRETNFFLLAES